MTLRGRLTSAFLAVVLGPVLLGALFVAGTLAAVSRHQAEERLNLAAATIRTSINALCQQLHTAAGAVALLGDPASRSGTAGHLVTRGLAGAVMITNPGGVVTFVTPGAPSRPWTSCGGPVAPETTPRALAARVEVRSRSGDLVGAVWAAQALDAAFVRRLAATSGAAVTLLRREPAPGTGESTARPVHDATGASPTNPPTGPSPAPAAPPPAGSPTTPAAVSSGSRSESPRSSPASTSAAAGVGELTGPDLADDPGIGQTTEQSTESMSARAGVLAAARRISGDTVVRTDGGRYVRRVGPSPGQPLPLVVSVPRDPPAARYAFLGVVVLVAGIVAVVAAWRLARSTTRPLTELVWAAGRVADGDLAARVPVRAPDEVGRLADSFNRMTRETQSYRRALRISRHQLRDQLAVLGDTLASTHDLDRILRVILRTAMIATGARAGVVLLRDPESGDLVGQGAKGLGEAPTQTPSGTAEPCEPAFAPGTLRIPLGRGLLGSVAASGQPRRGRLDRDDPSLYESEPRCQTYVAVPFSVPVRTGTSGVPAREPTGWYPLGTDHGRSPVAGGASPPPAVDPRPEVPSVDDGEAAPTLGVLALYDRLGADEFDDADLATLRSFASHAAVAVDNVRAHEEVQRLSLTDPLTGLWNYRCLRESLRREIERASRFGHTLGLLALDLDRFKEVNDTYGHAAGDAVLAEFAQRIRGTMREVDFAFRQGGEEFVVLLPETDARGAVRVAERLGAAVRESPIILRPKPGGSAPVRAEVAVTVSIGVAVYPDHATTGPQLLAAADEALYAAKAAGRDTYRTATTGARGTAVRADPAAGGAPGVIRPGSGPGQASGGALSGPQPPRQGRGR
ncbi:diguanylate cyclase [Micromonospora sp. HM5-17]|uniref:diguanylate cyclase n=1 Tax=Micromonospora sp. HM5-17 TaxID=2487710 RepID=UPI00267CB551